MYTRSLTARFLGSFSNFLFSIVLGALVSEPVGWLGALATAWCVFFFRDPDRVVPQRGNLVVSPADGLVQMIQPAVPPPRPVRPPRSRAPAGSPGPGRRASGRTRAGARCRC